MAALITATRRLHVRPAGQAQETPRGRIYPLTHTPMGYILQISYPNKGVWIMSATTTTEYRATDVTCGYCETAIRSEVSEIAGETGMEVSARPDRYAKAA